uniref:ABC-type antigen peptide transporter n=1 Tax=Plectus sambesii TaxID=2011161 RepID=A0A914WAM2_9BILA
MTLRRLPAVVVAISVALLDLTVTLLALGWYGQPKDGFDLSRIRSCLEAPYDIRTSLLDLFLLCILRISIILGGVLGVVYNTTVGVERAKKSQLAVICLVMLLWAFSPTKILALDEFEGNLRNVGCWISIAWNVVASVGLVVVWKFVICNVKADPSTITAEDTTPLVEAEAAANNQTSATSESDKKKVEIPPLNRETFAHVGRLLQYCKAEWMWYLLGFIFLFVYSGARIFIPYYTGQVIANIVVTKSYAELLKCVFIMGGLSLVSAIFGGARGGCFQYAIAKVNREVRCGLFRSLVRQEIGFYDATKTGEVTSRLTADCQTMSDSVALNVNVFLRNVVMLVGALAFMFKLSWQLSLITFIAIPVIGLVSKLYGAYYDRLSEDTQTSLAKANEVADEVLSSMRTVRSFANEMNEADRYSSFLNVTLDIAKKKAWAYVGYIWTNEIFDSAILVAVLWYGGHLVLSGRMTAEGLISFLLYQLQLGENLYSIGYVWTGLMQSVGASRKVLEYIDRPPEIKNDGKLVPATLDATIEFKDVCFSYPSRPDTQVLNNMSFAVKAGETVALVGPSGGGKSSCVSLLEHFYEPTSGDILLGGVSIREYAHKFLHTKIALVGQEPVLYARSVRENIAYALDAVDDEDVKRVATMANAHTFVTETKDGYETQVGEKGVQMSGGQKQRIAIARALIRKPAVLLLDEATSALDSESEHQVQQAIYQNLQGHTVLLIAHRLSTVERADRIIVINKGRVEQMGTHKELLRQDGIYRNLVQRQLIGSSVIEEPYDSSGPPSRPDTLDFESGRSSEVAFRSPLGSSVGSAQSTPTE